MCGRFGHSPKVVFLLTQFSVNCKLLSDSIFPNHSRTKGRTKTPVSTPGHKSAIGVHLILDYQCRAIQFDEITSAQKGYGEKMVTAALSSTPEDWQALVVMDYSEDFWDRIIERYCKISTI